MPSRSLTALSSPYSASTGTAHSASASASAATRAAPPLPRILDVVLLPEFGGVFNRPTLFFLANLRSGHVTSKKNGGEILGATSKNNIYKSFANEGTTARGALALRTVVSLIVFTRVTLEGVMSLEEVLRRDDQFRADAAKEVLDPGSEALALREMFEGASRELAETACTQTLNAQRWGACCQSWGAWRDQQQGMDSTVADCAIHMPVRTAMF